MVVVDHLLNQCEIAARREAVTLTPNDDTGDTRVGIDLAPDQREIAMHISIGCIAALAGAENDLKDTFAGGREAQAGKIRSVGGKIHRFILNERVGVMYRGIPRL